MDDLTGVKMVLRSLLLSYKDGCRLHSLPGAYRELDGCILPFKQLGYASLQQFLQHVPDVARLGRNREGEDVVFGVANEATAHIQKMVQRQRKTKSKPRSRGGKSRGGFQRARPPMGPRGPNVPTRFSGPRLRAPFYPPPRPGLPVRPVHPVQPIRHLGAKAISGIQKALLPTPRKGPQFSDRSGPPNLPPRLQSKTTPKPNPWIDNKNKPEFVIQDSTLPLPGESVSVTVSHIKDPHNLYVSIDSSAINTIMKRIQERMKSVTGECPAPVRPEDMVEVFCLARYSRDNYWYRAKITYAHRNAQSEPVVQVLFVDFGNSESRTLRDIRPITAEECATPAQCLKCSLFGILPRDVSWSDECNIELQRMIENRRVVMTVARIITDELCEVTLTVDDININHSLIARDLARRKNVEPPKLSPPVDQYPTVYISNFEKTTAVLVQFVGECYSDALKELEERMVREYSATDYSPGEFVVHVGGVYAALHQEEDGLSVWRVRVLKCRERRERRVVDCYLPDHGYSETVDIHRLRWLKDEFRYLPYQAVTLSLAGLEPFESDQFMLEQMMNEILDQEFDVVFSPDDPTKKSVTLYDPETNQNINEWLLLSLPDGSLSQSLPSPESDWGSDAIEVKVLNIQPDGMISVRVPGEGERRYIQMEEELQTYMKQLDPTSFPLDNLKRGDGIVACYEDVWYRAKVLDSNKTEVQVEFVDFGNRATVEGNLVISFARVKCDKICSLPIQRKDVKLSGIPPPGGEWTDQALELIGSLLDPDAKFQLKVDRVFDTGSPEVSLYGFSDDNQLVCINEYLLESDDIFTPDAVSASTSTQRLEIESGQGESGRSARRVVLSDDNSLSVSISQLDNSEVQENAEALKRLSLELKYYEARSIPRTVPIAERHQFMTVHVPWADDPSNFACIPLSSYDDLNDLRENMNERYKKYPVVDVSLIVGQMYAGKFENSWYRVIVKDVFQSKRQVNAYFVDFGESHQLERENLRPLDGSYQTIPKMAFRARLGGLAPEGGGWDSAARRSFRNLVVGKNLFCLIIDKRHIETGSVIVDLVCTNSPKDLPISKYLLQNGLAKIFIETA